MKKFLVTGATGFIGNYVVEKLVEMGCNDVVATSSNAENAKKFHWYRKVEYKELDFTKLNDRGNYFEYFNKPDVLIHLAWEGLPNYNNDFHLRENLPRHRSFITNMIEHGLIDLTIAGTCLEYGMQNGCLGEDLQCFPSNPYAEAKNELRKSIELFASERNCNFKWIRLFYMYGKGQNPKSLISQLERSIEKGDKVFNMSGGEQIRDFLPVDIVAEYIVRIATQQKVTGIINCCSGKPLSVKDFVINYLMQKNINLELNLGYYPYTDYEPMSFWGDDKKLKSILTP